MSAVARGWLLVGLLAVGMVLFGWTLANIDLGPEALRERAGFELRQMETYGFSVIRTRTVGGRKVSDELRGVQQPSRSWLQWDYADATVLIFERDGLWWQTQPGLLRPIRTPESIDAVLGEPPALTAARVLGIMSEPYVTKRGSTHYLLRGALPCTTLDPNGRTDIAARLAGHACLVEAYIARDNYQLEWLLVRATAFEGPDLFSVRYDLSRTLPAADPRPAP